MRLRGLHHVTAIVADMERTIGSMTDRQRHALATALRGERVETPVLAMR